MKNLKLNIFDSISLWWRHDAKFYHRNFIIGIKNLIKWFPVIWRDRDWDTYYIFDVLKFKIAQQSKYIGYHDRHVSAKRDSEIMMTVVKLIERVQDETYNTEYVKYHETKYFSVDTDINHDGKKLYEWKSEQLFENFDEYFKKYPRQYKRVMSGEINRFNRPIKEKGKQLIAMEIAHENQERCKKLLFKILESNILKWWD